MKDEAEDAQYYKLPADQNHASAQRYYALCLANERGVVKNDVSSQNRYAICLVTGRGVVRNEAQAQYCKLAADHNDALVQFNDAVCLAKGRGVVKDEAEAVQYYKPAPTRIIYRSNSLMHSALRTGKWL